MLVERGSKATQQPYEGPVMALLRNQVEHYPEGPPDKEVPLSHGIKRRKS